MKKLIICGKVQGVFFRASTAEFARKLNLTGYVRNLENGLVEVVAKGSKINELINYCKSGPNLAQVEKVDVSDIPDEDFNEFRII